jgi:hypothetical protein
MPFYWGTVRQAERKLFCAQLNLQVTHNKASFFLEKQTREGEVKLFKKRK